VRYWAGRALAGGRFEPDAEVDRLEWVPGAEARGQLTNSQDVTVLDAFLTAPVCTYPIVLQRHGKAERRSPDYPDDLARPLAAAGVAQASALAGLLRAYGAEDAVSSPAVRCVATVRPYAEQAGLTLRTDPALTEIAYVHAPRAIVAWLRELIGRRRGTVACTHGPLLDELISAVLYNPALGGHAGRDDGPSLGGRGWSDEAAERWANDPLPTGCAWVLHFDAADGSTADGDAAPALVAVDRLKP
jgi:8-oxo-dGTP diphosphatase